MALITIRKGHSDSAYSAHVRLLLALLTASLALLALAPTAHASKQAIDFFGGNGTLGGQFGSASAVAVNETGAGPGDPGDVYVLDSSNHRIQRFGRDDNGTPGNTPAATVDDTYFFISAWGADVDSTPSGGSDYEICAVAADCKAALASAGNGTVAGNGALGNASGGLALDQDTGNIYVSDTDNNRVNVYDGVGAFLRSFGYDVVGSGPGNAGTGYEVCVGANGDACKKGLSGTGAGQIGASPFAEPGAGGIAVSTPDADPATGTVFLADGGNRRVDTYGLDGSAPSSFGSGQFPEIFLHNFFLSMEPTEVAVDSRGIVYVVAGRAGGNFRIERYDSQNANGGGVGFLAPILTPQNEEQWLTEEGTAGQFRLSFGGKTTTDLPYNANTGQVRTALEALSSIGPGNVVINQAGVFGVENISVTFTGALADTDVEQLTVTNGTTPLTGTIPVHTAYNGHPGLAPRARVRALAVDPDTDGGGPDTDVLYAERHNLIQQFGPLNPAGLTAPPSAVDDAHGTSKASNEANGLAAEPSTGRLYAAAGGTAGQGVYVLDTTGPPPTATLDSVDGITANSAELHATIDPNGPPATRYHFEYSTDGVNWISLPEVFLGIQEDPQLVEAHLEPKPLGLEPNTEYHVRVVAGRKFATPIVSNALTFTTDPVPPLAETTGAPVRTTTTAQINGRVTPLGTATTYHFEYGAEGPCAANPCTSTPSMPAGAGFLTELVAEQITELQPDTTYHYRLVAENGVGSPAAGADMTVTTRASDELPGRSDTFPGPPGSDRAWEQVSIADSSGNPVSPFFPAAFSDDGNRAVYGIAGGTPISPTGSIQNFYFSQRTPTGWQTISLTPPRDQLAGQFWRGIHGTADLSTILTVNTNATTASAVWKFSVDAGPTPLYQAPRHFEFFGLSVDGSRALQIEEDAVYDVTSSPAQVVSLLPGNVPGPCRIATFGALVSEGSWISADGSLVYFPAVPEPPCPTGTRQLYVRDLVAGQTELVSGPPLSGSDCGGSLIKGVPGAAFFLTESRLSADDPVDCGEPGDFDVYRYTTDDGSLDCVTCVTPGFGVGVQAGNGGPSDVAVADDGSRVYFQTGRRLLPGAPDGVGVYRVEVETGALAYVGPIGASGTTVNSMALSADGSILAFSSDRADFNPLGGVSDNGGGTQYYRYDDRDRSLVCVSCPPDGSSPPAEVDGSLQLITNANLRHNNRGLSDDGSTIAFGTPAALVGADQNTPGPGQSPLAGEDIYEWRDGRLILVTDGHRNWVEDQEVGVGFADAPDVKGVSADGSNIYFLASAAYTPDAPDALTRLYTARIGGGIHFPKPPPPCPLEVCQGTPKGAPEEQEPASRNFSGSGNLSKTPARRCPKGKRKVSRAGKTRCVKKKGARKQRRAANHDRRANR